MNGYQTGNGTKRNELVAGVLVAILLLGGAAWAAKRSGTLQLKPDQPDQQQQQAQATPPPTTDLFRDMINMQNRMDRMFENAFGSYNGFPEFDAIWNNQAELPAVDMQESPENYVVTMDLPGMDKSDISIEVKGNVLQVSAERRNTTSKKDEKTLMQERSFSSVHREIALPKAVDAGKVDAEYKDGVLKITLPKTARDEAPAKIEVK